MDFAHFGLTRRPFRPTPDTDSYFPAAAHEAALVALRTAFTAHAGLALLDGDPGTGKTLVALRFLEGLDAAVPRVFIPAPRFSRPADLYQAILFDLGAEYRGLTEQELRLAVTEKLLGGLIEGRPTVVVLDEAQHLSTELLEEVRLLGNLESRTAKAAFVVLVALPHLRERLAMPELAAFAQRVSARCRVGPLSREESIEYLGQQINFAGGRPDALLTGESRELLADRCRGIPRLLNQTASLAFALAATAGAEEVDAEATIEALAQLGLAEPPADGPVLIPHPIRTPKRRTQKRKSA
jgi:type II secretory pathway predicted ATPase ExeA